MLEIAQAGIFECTYGGWGVGQEFGYLHLKGVPILLVLKKEKLVDMSYMPFILNSKKYTKGQPSQIRVYSNHNVLTKIVNSFLDQL